MLNRLQDWMLRVDGPDDQKTRLGRSPSLGGRAKQRRKHVGLASGLGAMCLLCLWMTSTVFGQARITSTEPIILAEPAVGASRPVVAADPWGSVHVIWSHRYGAERRVSDGGGQLGDALYHIQWDGRQWSEPNDIIAPSSDLRDLHATVGTDGRIYLVWSSMDGLYFSYAPVFDAHDAASWQPPQMIAEGLFEDSQLVLGRYGQVNVVSVMMRGDLAKNVIHTGSVDGGISWSLPMAISEVYHVDTTASARPNIVVDPQDGLHVVWDEHWAPDWMSRRILYARSEDNGATWTSPNSLAEVEVSGEWAAHPSLVSTDDGGLHLVWVCGKVAAHRCYCASRDGGLSWSRTQRIFGELLGSAGGDVLEADHEGNLHFVGLLRYPQAVYYGFKPNGGPWRRAFVAVDQPAPQNGHFYRSSLSEGNQLHVVWQRGPEVGDVVYVRIATEASPLAPGALPTPWSSPEAVRNDQPTTVARALPGTVAYPTPIGSTAYSTGIQPKSSLWVLTWMLLPSAAMIVLIVGLRLAGHA